jgi:hypothetical protein
MANADPNAPSPRQIVKVERQKYTGSTLQRQKKFAADVIGWAGPQGHIFIVGNEQFVNQFDGLGGGRVKIVSSVKLPQMPAETNVGGPGSFGGPGGPGGGPGGFGGRGGGPGGPGGGAFGGRGFGGGPGMGGPMGGFAGESEVVIGEIVAAK